jgi:hypothetical protein
MTKLQRTSENELSSTLPLAIVDRHFRRTVGGRAVPCGGGAATRGAEEIEETWIVVWPAAVACRLVFWALN